MKKILLTIILLVGILLVSSPISADTQEGFSPQYFSYLFHLYYDHGQLFADRDFQFKYDILSEQYQPGTATTQFPYRGDIINFTGEIGGHFVFDPKQGDTHFIAGKLPVKAPYVADGQRAVFYDAQNNPILTISLADSSYCNDDGICNTDTGEDSLSCPKDCKQTLPAPPVTSTTPTSGGSSSGLLSGIIYSIIGLLLIVGLWWLYKKRSSGGSTSSGLNLPPPPSTPLPTPPPPPNPSNPV